MQQDDDLPLFSWQPPTAEIIPFPTGPAFLRRRALALAKEIHAIIEQSERNKRASS